MKATRIAERIRNPKSVVNQESVVVYLHHLDDLTIHVVKEGRIDDQKELEIEVECGRNGVMCVKPISGPLTVNFNG
jgi:hypothetical protein